jgi:hypothetical protein
MVKPKSYTFEGKAARRLIPGDRLQSSTGKIMVVSKVQNLENKTIILFDGDMEVDFHPYHELKVIVK